MKIFQSHVALAALAAAWLVLGPHTSAQEALRDDLHSKRRTLTVTGNGEAAAAPDKAVVRLGATAQMDEAAAAQLKVSETMQKAIDAIEKSGIPRRSIRTSGLVLTPVYSSPKGSQPNDPRVVGYRAANTIEVTAEDIKLVGKIIDAGLSAGANQLQGVSFGLQNDLPHRQRALSMAADEAQRKAEVIAQALRIKLGDVIEVNEGGVHILQREQFGMARAMVADGMRTPVEPGEIQIQATVTVRYEISGSGKP